MLDSQRQQHLLYCVLVVNVVNNCKALSAVVKKGAFKTFLSH